MLVVLRMFFVGLNKMFSFLLISFSSFTVSFGECFSMSGSVFSFLGLALGSDNIGAGLWVRLLCSLRFV